MDLVASTFRLRPVSVVRDGNDGAFALTTEVNNSNQEIALRLHHVSAAGVKSGPVTIASGSGTVWFYRALLVPSSSGSCIAVWTDGTYGGALLAQRFDSNGAGQWPAPVAVGTGSQGFDYVAAASDGQGGAFVAYEESPAVAASRYFRIQRVTMAGALPWGATGTAIVSGNAADLPYAPPRIAVGPSELAVVWQSWNGSTNLPVYGVWVDFSGQLIGTRFSIGTSYELLGLVHRWVATDPAGGFYVTIQSSTLGLTVARFNSRSAAAQWTATAPTLAASGAYSLVEDGGGGALLAAVAAGGMVSVARYNAQGVNVWKYATAANVATATLVSLGGLYGPVPWVGPVAVGARPGGGAILVHTDWPQPATPHLHSRCFDDAGTVFGKDNDVSQAAGSQMFPLLADVVVPSMPPPSISLRPPYPGGPGRQPFDPEAASLVCIWQGASGNAGTVISGQKLGCCRTTYTGTVVVPPDFGCGVPIDWPLSIPATVHAAFPCGREGAGSFGLLPLPHLAFMPGSQLPGGLATPSVPVPDWVRILFENVPSDVSIELRGHDNAVVAKADHIDVARGVEQLHGRSLSLTFRPDQQLSYVIVFNRPRESAGPTVVPLGLRVEFGSGKAPALPPAGEHRE